MSDLGANRQEDEVVDIPSIREPSENDGWSSDLPVATPDDNPDDAGRLDLSGVEASPVEENPACTEGRNEDLGTDVTKEVLAERPDDGWGDDPSARAQESGEPDASEDIQRSDSAGDRLAASFETMHEQETESASDVQGDGWSGLTDSNSVDPGFTSPLDDAGQSPVAADRQADANPKNGDPLEVQAEVSPTDDSNFAGGFDEAESTPAVESDGDTMSRDANAAQQREFPRVDDARRAVAEAIDGADDPVAQSTNDVDAAREAVDGALREAKESAQPATSELEFTDIEQNDEGHNAVFRLELADGEVGWFKPVAGEESIDGWRYGIPDESGWKREVAAFQLDDVLGLGVVPETKGGTYDGLGAGSVQRDVPLGSKGLNAYSDADIDRLAVFDYITGNSDRHSDNYRTDVDGRPKATDNGFCFPESSIDGIRSDCS